MPTKRSVFPSLWNLESERTSEWVCLYASGVAEPDRSAAQWFIFRHWVAVFILQKYSSVSCWQAISFINVPHRPDFVLCLSFPPTLFFSPWFVHIAVWRRRLFLFHVLDTSVHRFLVPYSSLTYLQLLQRSYSSIMGNCSELKARKREACIGSSLSGSIQFLAAFFKYFMYICVCVFISLSYPTNDWHHFAWIIAA